jgi:hypothetical protein
MSDALKLADRGDLPLLHDVLEAKIDINGIFAKLHTDATQGSASCSAASAKGL